MNIHWKDWCWSWNTLATWCEELTHFKRSWCWERLRAGGEGDDRGWDSWMTSLTQWTRVWLDFRSQWWTVPWHAEVHGLQRVGHDRATELIYAFIFSYNCEVVSLHFLSFFFFFLEFIIFKQQCHTNFNNQNLWI